MDNIDFEKFFYNLSLTWFYTEPVLFKVYLTHTLEKCTEMECGIRSGQGKIQYNPEFLMNYSQKQIKDELRYELYRIMLRHPYRKKPYEVDEELWFKASEITIKQIFLNTYRLEKDQSIEYYYEKLTGLERNDEKDEKAVDCGEASGDSDGEKKEDKTEEQKSDDEKDDESKQTESDDCRENKSATENTINQDSAESKSDNEKGESQSENCNDNVDEKDKNCEQNLQSTEADSSNSANNDSSSKEHSVPETELWGEDDLQSESKLESILVKVGGNWGSVPESIKREVGKIQIKPVPRFVRILKGFRSSVSFNQRQLTRMRPNRRSGFLRMGSKYSLLPRILIAVDVSGSIYDEHLQVFFGAISQIFKTEIKGVDVIQFDAAVEGKAQQFTKIPERITRLATGGTNFQCVVDYTAKHNFYDGLVIFTDGGAAEPEIPENLHASILWMTFAHAQVRDWMNKSGKVAWIYEDNEVNWVQVEDKE